MNVHDGSYGSLSEALFYFNNAPAYAAHCILYLIQFFPLLSKPMLGIKETREDKQPEQNERIADGRPVHEIQDGHDSSRKIPRIRHGLI